MIELNFLTAMLLVVAFADALLPTLILFNALDVRRVGYLIVGSYAVSAWVLAVSLVYASQSPLLFSYSVTGVYIAGIVIALGLFFFVNSEYNDISQKYAVAIKYVSIASALVLVYAILFTDYVLVGSTLTAGKKVFILGDYYIFYAIFLSVTFLISLARLVLLSLPRNNVYDESKEAMGKVEFTLIFFAMLAPIVASLLGSILMPYFNNFSLFWLGPMMSIIYMFISVYGMVRYKLFDARVISSEFIVFTLWFILFLQIIASDSQRNTLTSLIVLIAAVFVGYFLIRSVRKEVILRERISNQTEELQHAYEKLEQLSQQKSEFLSIATHQLRTPLTAINGYASLLLGGSYGETTPKMKEILSRVVHSGVLMSQTIEDFLSVSRIEQGRMVYDYSDFDVRTLISEVTNELSEQAKGRNLVLHGVPGDQPLMVSADYGKLKHVISNLTDNAIKYTEHGSVTVTGSTFENSIRVTITDTGIGIPPDEIGKLFDKFVRARGASKVNISGTGLGLYVAKQMIEAHKGKVWAESDGSGKGSRFIIELPAFGR